MFLWSRRVAAHQGVEEGSLEKEIFEMDIQQLVSRREKESIREGDSGAQSIPGILPSVTRKKNMLGDLVE